MADLRDIPFAEMPALGLDVLGKTIGRALTGTSPAPLPAGTFQSSI